MESIPKFIHSLRVDIIGPTNSQPIEAFVCDFVQVSLKLYLIINIEKKKQKKNKNIFL